LSDILFILSAVATVLGAYYLVKNTIIVRTNVARLETINFTSVSQSESTKLRAIIADRLKRDRNAKEGFVILVIGLALVLITYFKAAL
jgi:hypothetical protein